MLDTRIRREGASFEVEAQFLGSTSPWSVELLVRAPGYVGRVLPLLVERGEEIRVEVVLDKGEDISGQVLTASGRPIADLEVLVLPMASAPDGFVTADILNSQRQLLESDRESTSFARITTDREGRFLVRGFGPGAYGLVADGLEWTLRHERLLAPGDTNVLVLAVRAHAVYGRVRDARSGALLDGVSAKIVLRTPKIASDPRRFVVEEGRLQIIWDPEGWSAKEGYEVELSLLADGYLPKQVTAAFARGTIHKWLDVVLEPVEAPRLGTALLEVVDTKGNPVGFALTVRVRDEADRDLPPSAFRVEELGRGRLRLSAPPGRWSVRVSPRDGVGWSVGWSGELAIPVDGEAAIACRFPPFGIVRVKRASFTEGSPTRILAVESEEGRSSGMYSMKGAEMQCVLPPGAWTIRLEGARHPSRRSVAVENGVETAIEFDE